MTASNPPLTLEWLPGRFAICRLGPTDPIPSWASADDSQTLLAITRTDRELSIVIDQCRVPAGVRSQVGFVAMRIVGTLDFSLTGVISRLTTPLAAAGIPVFVISTFDTDIILVAAEHQDRACHALGCSAILSSPQAGTAVASGFET